MRCVQRNREWFYQHCDCGHLSEHGTFCSHTDSQLVSHCQQGSTCIVKWYPISQDKEKTDDWPRCSSERGALLFEHISVLHPKGKSLWGATTYFQLNTAWRLTFISHLKITHAEPWQHWVPNRKRHKREAKERAAGIKDYRVEQRLLGNASQFAQELTFS